VNVPRDPDGSRPDLLDGLSYRCVIGIGGKVGIVLEVVVPCHRGTRYGDVRRDDGGTIIRAQRREQPVELSGGRWKSNLPVQPDRGLPGNHAGVAKIDHMVPGFATEQLFMTAGVDIDHIVVAQQMHAGSGKPVEDIRQLRYAAQIGLRVLVVDPVAEVDQQICAGFDGPRHEGFNHRTHVEVSAGVEGVMNVGDDCDPHVTLRCRIHPCAFACEQNISHSKYHM
jgi:hypothetical protein